MSIIEEAIDRIDEIFTDVVLDDAKKNNMKKNTIKPLSGAELTWKYNAEKLQPNNQTRPERFPLIFDKLKELYPEAKRICSFGCSYGEECQALAKRFPNAEIIGVDIDHWVITEARRRNKNDNIIFTDEIRCAGKFDIITSLMVLFCLNTPLPKDRWQKTLTKIDNHLNDGGICAIYTSEYDPTEVLTPDKYEVINGWMREHNKKSQEYFNGYYRKRFSQLK